MSSNYFEKLRIRVREIDDGIAKLITTWNLQHVLIGRFEECTAETNSYVEAVWKTIKDTQSGMEEILSEIKGDPDNTIPMEQFLQETRKEYQGLKEMCDDLETVLAEYDCRFSKNDSSDKENINNSKNQSFNGSSPERTDNSQVECTPCFSRIPVCNKLLTPAISDGSFIANKDYVCTPGERPQEPIYSTHFYNILRK
ncbi:unnamed protein product [Xylocopa violacea]|uniref:Uncharacterized protein n=1 Tax=Xylocopa violacea TaxID=135666 RepID=A0ABP1N4F9_XYLVO